MSHRRFPVLIGCTTALFALAACDSDSTGPETDLTEEEVEVMMEALMEAGTFHFVPLGFGGAHLESGSVDLPQSAQQQTWDETVPCPGGGSVHLEGTGGYEGEGGSEVMTANVTQTHQSCSSSANGTEWTFDGDPSVTLDMTLTFSETEEGEEMSLNMSQGGGIAWQTNDRAGSCSIDVDYALDAVETRDGWSGTLDVQGSVCGYSISVSESFPQ